MTTTKQPTLTEFLANLRPDQILLRLAELEAERRALQVLLRAARRRQLATEERKGGDNGKR